jgi:peptide chain release factor subunit 1
MVEDMRKALELGAVEDLIIWDNLETNRYVLRNYQSGEEMVMYMTKEQEGNENLFHDEGGAELEVIEKEPLVEWMASNYKKFGCNLEFVTD